MNDKKISELLESCLQWREETDGTNLEAAARYPEHQAELLELLEVTDQFNLIDIPGPRPQFTAVARTRLMNRIQAIEKAKAITSVTESKPPRHIRHTNKLTRRLSMTWIIVIGLLAAALAGGGGVAYASTDALPGDSLYPVKTALQDIELTFADDEADVDLLLGYMAENIQEMERLAQQGRLDDIEDGLGQYVENFQAFTQTRTRVNYEDAGSEQSINQRLQTQSEALEKLQQQVKTNDKLQEKLKTAEQLTETGQTYGPNEGGKPDEPGEPNGAGPGNAGDGNSGNGSGDGQGKPEDAGDGSGDGQGKPEDAGNSGSEGQSNGCKMTDEGEVCKPEDVGYLCSENAAGELKCTQEHPEKGYGKYICEKAADDEIICKPENAGDGHNGQGGGAGEPGDGGGGKP